MKIVTLSGGLLGVLLMTASPRLEASIPPECSPQTVRMPVGQQPESVLAADLNGDGRSDLVTANGSSDDISVLLAGEDGSFRERRFPVGSGP
ncbi:MAG: VCBS repeat-containing protein, partial [Acidobacteria bacterium]